MPMKESGITIWLTGIPSSGKTTIARILASRLNAELLDGDVIRNTPISEGLGFSWEDRETHIRRVGFIAGLLAKHTNVVASFISPSARVRRELREAIPGFIEVYVDCPVGICIERDVKGLYRKAMAGEIKELTGLDGRYDIPQHPDIHLHTDRESVSQSVERVLEWYQ